MTLLGAEVRESLSLPEPGEARRIRVRAHVSRARLGAELGVTAQSVYRYERGDRVPRGDRRRAYARLLAELDQVTRHG